MLREVKNLHIKPRIIPFQLTTTSGRTATVDIGYGDYTATSPSTAGAGTLTCRDGFYRNGLFFGTPGASATGYYVTYNSATPSNQAMPFSVLDTAGSPVESSIDGFCFGWDSSDISVCKQQRVAATNEAPRIIWGKITGATGEVAIGSGDFSCTRTAAGNYTITFKKAFARTPVIKADVLNPSSVSSVRYHTKTATGVSIVTGSAGTAGDRNFYICAIGSDACSDSARGRLPLQNSQRKPRIVAGQVTNTSGTWSLSIGSGDFTSLTDNGAGDFSLTLVQPFVREPAIFVNTTTQRCQVGTNASGTFSILTKNAGGTNTDVDGVTNFFIIGSDDASEY